MPFGFDPHLVAYGVAMYALGALAGAGLMMSICAAAERAKDTQP